MTTFSPEQIARRRERDNLRYRRDLAKAGKTLKADRPKIEKPPKPIVIAKPRPAPAYHRWSPETEAGNPNNVPVTRLPTPLPRFHVEAPSDGFASMGIGRYAA